MTFTPTDWSSPKPVDVTAVKDDDSVQDPAVTLSHTVTGATEYSGISVGMVTVTIVETDRPPGNNPATGRPTITGTTLVGRTLTAHTTDIQDPDGLTNVQYYYQWFRVDDGVESDITGANGSTYRLVSADAGNRLKVRVSFTDDDGFGEELTSLETDTVRRPAPPPPPPPPPSAGDANADGDVRRQQLQRAGGAVGGGDGASESGSCQPGDHPSDGEKRRRRH